jgi:hypothetical protein
VPAWDLCQLDGNDMSEQVRTRAVLQAVLLRTLSQHANGLGIRDAYDAIHSQYSFPSDWYREIPRAEGYAALAERGYADWRHVPQHQLIELVSTEPQWQNELRWARNDLRERGFLDTTAQRGVWKLTPAGLVAAERPEESIDLRPEERIVATPSPKRHVPAQPARSAPEGTSLSPRDALVQKLHALINSMPLDDLDLLVDLTRVVRMRSIGGDSGPLRADGN